MVAEIAETWTRKCEAYQELESDSSVTRQLEDWALAGRTSELIQGEVKPEERAERIRWAVGRMVGRKPYQKVIAEVLGDTGDSALNTAYRIAIGELPHEADVLASIYPGQGNLFEKARAICQNRVHAFAERAR